MLISLWCSLHDKDYCSGHIAQPSDDALGFFRRPGRGWPYHIAPVKKACFSAARWHEILNTPFHFPQCHSRPYLVSSRRILLAENFVLRSAADPDTCAAEKGVRLSVAFSVTFLNVVLP